MTFPTDKLPAVAGIAKRINEQIQSQYLAGLWYADIGRGLLWQHVKSPMKLHSDFGCRAMPYRAPTWSWASIDLPVESSNCDSHISYSHSHDITEIDKRFKVLEASCDVAGANPYGCVTSGYLRVQGAVIVTKLCSRRATEHKNSSERKRKRGDGRSVEIGGEAKRTGDKGNYDCWLNIPESFETSMYMASFDFDISAEGDQYIPDGCTIFALLVGRSTVDVENIDYSILLIVVKRNPKTFERIGLLCLLKDADRVYEGAEEMTLDII